MGVVYKEQLRTMINQEWTGLLLVLLDDGL